jgi:AraC-like DNA-binding protein
VRRGSTYPPPQHPSTHAFDWSHGRVLPYFQLVYVSEGTGYLEGPDGLRSVIPRHACFFVKPGEWHRYGPDPATGWTEHWFELRGHLVHDWLAHCGVARVANPVRLVDPGAVEDPFQELHSALRAPEHRSRRVAGALAMLILTIVLAQAGEDGGAPVEDVLTRRVRDRLSEDFGRSAGLGALARELGISYPTLHRRFKNCTGLSPKQYRTKLRIARAEVLLASTELSIKEIAAALGYYSLFHFSAQFKAATGLPPSSWRRQNRNSLWP